MENRFAKRGIGGPPKEHEPPKRIPNIQETLRKDIARISATSGDTVQYIPTQEEMMDISRQMNEVLLSPAAAEHIHATLIEKYPKFQPYIDAKLEPLIPAARQHREEKQKKQQEEKAKKNTDLRMEIRRICNIEDISLLPKNEDVEFFRECLLYVWTHPEDAPTLEKKLGKDFPHLRPWFTKRFSEVAALSKSLEE